MKLGTLIAIATLAMAMTLGGAVTPADAGDKKKNSHQQGSNKKVHISPNVSTKNLQLLEKKLRAGHTKHAVSKELKRREAVDTLAGGIATRRGAEHLFWLGVLGTEEGKKHRSRRH